jgi:hypothetical protein
MLRMTRTCPPLFIQRHKTVSLSFPNLVVIGARECVLGALGDGEERDPRGEG